ncbi:MAG: methionine synthase [Mycobacteriales bacterium]
MTAGAVLPWRAGVSTGVGSMPGEDPYSSLRVVLEDCPDLVFLPELPARGPGAGLIGRGAALLVDMPVDLQPSGWRFVDRPGLDARRAHDLLSRDLDAAEELLAGYTGLLKVQATGPWTLAAGVELNRGDKALADPGACRDLAESLAEGVRRLAADVVHRVPGATVLLQLDEPSLPAVLLGRVRTASGFGALAAVEEPAAESVLKLVLGAAGVPGVAHCCAQRPPIALLHRSGAQALSLDAGQLSAADDEAIGEAVEAGAGLLLGVLPGTDSPMSDLPTTLAPVRAMWRRLGFDPELLGRTVVLTPSCGLAGASPAYSRAALARCREAARALAEDPEATGG